MNDTKHHVLADITMYSIANGGRPVPTPANFFSCPLQVDGKNFDCRLILKNIGSLFPGDEIHKVPILFLDPSAARSVFKEGTKFKIWEFGFIGEGVVVEDNRFA